MLMPVNRRIAALISQLPSSIGESFGVCDQHSAFSGCDLLIWIKRKQPGIAKNPDFAATHLSTECFARVFDYVDCVGRTCPERSRTGPRPPIWSLCHFFHCLNVNRNTKGVNPHNQPRVFSDRCGNQFWCCVVSL